MATALTPFEQEAVDRGRAVVVHIDEAGIESRFESMCLARGFAYASERMEAVRQRVHQHLRDAGWTDFGGFVG